MHIIGVVIWECVGIHKDILSSLRLPCATQSLLTDIEAVNFALSIGQRACS